MVTRDHDTLNPLTQDSNARETVDYTFGTVKLA